MPATLVRSENASRRGGPRDLSWTIVVGPILSVLAGFIAVEYSQDLDGMPSQLDLIVGLVTALLGLQVDLLLRSHRRDAERTRQGRLIEQMEQVEWLPELVSSLVHDVQQVRAKHGDTLISDAMYRTLAQSAKALTDFKLGRLTTDFDDNAWVFHLTEGVQHTMLASSVQDVDLTFWQSTAGRRYWDLQVDRMQPRKGNDGVKITRIFIYRDWTQPLDALAREQSDAGVRVMRVPLSRVPIRYRKDLIVWDKAAGYETQVNAAGDANENLFTVDREDVTRLLEQLELVESLAEVFPPPDTAPPTAPAGNGENRSSRFNGDSTQTAAEDAAGDQGKDMPSKR